MAFDLKEGTDDTMSEMNLIPLIDIMLVLMIIFLVTGAALSPMIPLDLPQTAATTNPAPEVVVWLSIDATGQLYLDETPTSMQALALELQKMPKEAQINLRADKDGRYETVAQVLAHATGAGLQKIAFVSE